jgi:AbrB family transcriptional regulator (stage V sporulation protein T)
MIMKATGIVRKIDELGRIVVPKEIRRTLRIHEGDPMEIFVDHDGEIMLRKYSPINELGEFAEQYADALAKTTGHIIAITDKEQLIAVSGSGKKELTGREISRELEDVIIEKESVVAGKEDKNFVFIIRDKSIEFTSQIIIPITSNGDAIGSVLILEKDPEVKLGETEIKLADTAAVFLGKQME